MSLKIKVPVKKIRKENVCEKVEKTLKNDPENAYTIMGLMIENFGVKEEEILGKSFSDWPKEYPTLYSRIRRCLDELVEKNKIDMTKDGKAYVYWWKDE